MMLKDISNALKEDLHSAGDITSQAIFKDHMDEFQLICKEDGILSCIEIFKEVFQLLDPQIRTEIYYEDGMKINNGDVIAEISGKLNRGIIELENAIVNAAIIVNAATHNKRSIGCHFIRE